MHWLTCVILVGVLGLGQSLAVNQCVFPVNIYMPVNPTHIKNRYVFKIDSKNIDLLFISGIGY